MYMYMVWVANIVYWVSYMALSAPSSLKDIRYVEILNGSEDRHDAIGTLCMIERENTVHT